MVQYRLLLQRIIRLNDPSRHVDAGPRQRELDGLRIGAHLHAIHRLRLAMELQRIGAIATHGAAASKKQTHCRGRRRPDCHFDSGHFQ